MENRERKRSAGQEQKARHGTEALGGLEGTDRDGRIMTEDGGRTPSKALSGPAQPAQHSRVALRLALVAAALLEG